MIHTDQHSGALNTRLTLSTVYSESDYWHVLGGRVVMFWYGDMLREEINWPARFNRLLQAVQSPSRITRAATINATMLLQQVMDAHGFAMEGDALRWLLGHDAQRLWSLPADVVDVPDGADD